jgi:hypothetical protein
MFQGRHFYHGNVRKAIIAFGTIFNAITVRRYNSTGVLIQELPVPLSYGPKQKFLQRIEAVGSLDTGRSPVGMTLPRLAFTMESLTYDQTRKLPVTRKTVKANNNGSFTEGYVATPYNMSIKLSVISKNQEDGLQIIEQILPFFSPDFNVTVHEIPQLDIRRDIQILLDSVSYDGDETGDYQNRTFITWDLMFTMKLNFYGFIGDAELIRTAFANVYIGDDSSGSGRKITVKATPNDVGWVNTGWANGALEEDSWVESDPNRPYTISTTFDDIFPALSLDFTDTVITQDTVTTS